ncbi:DUF1127 domain-containing protein [Oceanibaculum indicum]|uniref:DUF1127 domain-containing protein n=1 Tax=Oceanibaculum indicum TaxID=526216 RepID=UPI0015FF081B|nr:DUF1127 domain-containing protein [Oceanibaculum indicum]
MMQRSRSAPYFDNSGNIVKFPARPATHQSPPGLPVRQEPLCLASLPALWRHWRRERRDWQALRQMDAAALADIGLSPLLLREAGPASLVGLLATYLRHRRFFSLRSERNRHVCC